jgi:crotonobetainyl-CoA:carnitine CoA-transferase CaiB-like acyl-CoA transferase
MALLVALLERDVSGLGQHIDVNMNAAANVTTEAGSYTWMVNGGTVQRQTGRHAGINPSMPSQVRCADERYVNSGVPPRQPSHFAAMLDWLGSLGLLEEFAEAPFLEVGAAMTGRLDLSKIAEDDEVRAVFQAGREAVNFIASKLGAYEFFVGAQERGLQVGIIYSPEEVFTDPHFVARGFPVEVEHPDLGRSFTYPGAPYKFERSPWRIARRAPLLGEDQALLE